MTDGRTPWDEPTTIDRHDLPDEPGIPHRHPDTDMRPAAGIVVAVAAVLAVGILVALFWWLGHG